MGRCAARIDDQRGRLYPFTVECAVSAQPDVQRGAVVAHRGWRVLLVEFKRPIGAAQVAELMASLAWAGINDIRIVKKLPVDKRHNAKIDYSALQQLVID